MGKRIVLGVVALAVFGLFLVAMGRLMPVAHVAEKVLPAPAAAPARLKSPNPTRSQAPAASSNTSGQALSVSAGALLPSALGSDGKIDAGAVLTVLNEIPTASGSAQGYQRTAFGPAWGDVNHNGCDTRDDILTRDLTNVTYLPDTHDCVVVSGTLVSPYTAATISFAKAKATDVQIDHLVPLGWAWQYGAGTWTPAQREQFANDPLNLTAVDGPSNEQKSDSGPAGWMPPSQAYSCTYVARFTFVVHQYALAIDYADRETIRRTLAGC